MRRHLTALTALPLLVAIATGGASAAEPYTPEDTVVRSVVASPSPTGVDIAATIDFGGQAPVVLGEDAVGDAFPNPEVATLMGTDLTKIQAYRTGPTAPLTLEWHAAALDSLPPPEVVRFYWPFAVNGVSLAAQVKTTDIASAATVGDGEPATILDNVSQSPEAGVPGFRLRGNCAQVADTLNNCGHIAWVTGEFDTEHDVVRIHIPLTLAKAGALRPGATIQHGGSAHTAIQVGADIAPTRDVVMQEEDYVIPDAAATATLVDSAGTTVATGSLTAADDGQWQGSLVAPGSGIYRLDVDGCFATNCATQSTEVVIP